MWIVFAAWLCVHAHSGPMGETFEFDVPAIKRPTSTRPLDSVEVEVPGEMSTERVGQILADLMLEGRLQAPDFMYETDAVDSPTKFNGKPDSMANPRMKSHEEAENRLHASTIFSDAPPIISFPSPPPIRLMGQPADPKELDAKDNGNKQGKQKEVMPGALIWDDYIFEPESPQTSLPETPPDTNVLFQLSPEFYDICKTQKSAYHCKRIFRIVECAVLWAQDPCDPGVNVICAEEGSDLDKSHWGEARLRDEIHDELFWYNDKLSIPDQVRMTNRFLSAYATVAPRHDWACGKAN
jgi:hypothetical protein